MNCFQTLHDLERRVANKLLTLQTALKKEQVSPTFHKTWVKTVPTFPFPIFIKKKCEIICMYVIKSNAYVHIFN